MRISLPLALGILVTMSFLSTVACATPTALPAPVASSTPPAVFGSPVSPTPSATPSSVTVSPTVLIGTPSAVASSIGTPTLIAQASEELVGFIVNQLAGGGKMDSYIAQSRSLPSSPADRLRMTPESLGRCWLSQPGSLRDCQPSDFQDNFNQESRGPWKHSYVIFGIVTVDAAGNQASVRLDRYTGPQASLGLLITLVKVNGEWREQTSRTVWVS